MQSAVRRTAETSRSCTAASIVSSFISSALVRGGPPRVVDDDVDAAESLDRLLDEALEVVRDCHVAADGERAEPICLALSVAAPGEHRDIRALAGERLGDPQARFPPTRRRRSPCGR